MFKKLLTSITVTSLLIVGVGNFSNAYDFQELSKNEQKSVKKQGVYYSLGVATSKNNIKIYRHCEDATNLKNKYTLNVHNGKFKKGQRYKIKYFVDYIADIKKL